MLFSTCKSDRLSVCLLFILRRKKNVKTAICGFKESYVLKFNYRAMKKSSPGSC